jgi:hypothetical protein
MSALPQHAFPSPLAATREGFDALVEQSLPQAYRLLIEHIQAGNHVPDAPSWLRNMAAAIAQKRLQCGVPLFAAPEQAGNPRTAAAA